MAVLCDEGDGKGRSFFFGLYAFFRAVITQSYEIEFSFCRPNLNLPLLMKYRNKSVPCLDVLLRSLAWSACRASALFKTAGGNVKILAMFIPNKVSSFPLSLFHSSSVLYLSATWSRFDHSIIYHLIFHSLAWRGGCVFPTEWYHSTNCKVGDAVAVQTTSTCTRPSGCKYCSFSW